MPIAKESSDFTPAPAGTHMARCFGCISLGTQKADKPNFRDSFRIMLMFELPHETVPHGDNGEAAPVVVSKEYSLTLSPKSTLRKHLDSWRGRAFKEEELKGWEVSNVVTHPCQLTIVHAPKANGSGVSARIESITGLVKGMTCPSQFHKAVKYEIEHGRNDVFRSLPEWVQKKIEKCVEWSTPAPTTADTGDDVPMDDVAGDPDCPF